jgi:hypothetical protein
MALANLLTTIRLDGRGTDPLLSGAQTDTEKKQLIRDR